MALQLYNTLTRRQEEFQPADGETVRVYSCGPTVYNYVHIGNLRTFAFQDVLRRYLRECGWKLDHVMNITDVDDKIIRNAAAAGQTIFDYTAQYRKAFLEDCDTLRLERPERITPATEYIPQMVDLIGKMRDRGHTYESEGSTYFRIASFPDYGKLSRIDTHGMKAGARVDQDEYEKDDARDFALWKAAREGEPAWDSPFGRGRPGWHIECSAMAMASLGPTLDIHTGGVDLTFPHHENEIAQSEAATGKPFVRFWVHAEHLLVDGQKMSKSLGNFYTLRDLLEKGYQPEAIRFLLVSTPHRKQLNFTFDGLQGAAAAIERLRNFARRVENPYPDGRNQDVKRLADEAVEAFHAGMNDDLNTAQALAAAFDFIREVNTKIDAGKFRDGNSADAWRVLDLFDSIFDVLRSDKEGKVAEEEIERLIAQRLQARRNKDFALADQIRDQLKADGVVLEDYTGGTRWHYADG
ncbi:MAG: cysteine--tRNA ligase [Acidobacteria bacterium]|nr:cysteine--tRNA ligase [Acidobacteriota bacterium]